MTEFAAFASSVSAHIFTLLAGCAVTVIINIAERHFMNGKKLPRWADITIIVLFLLFACFQAWRDKARQLSAEKAQHAADTQQATTSYSTLQKTFVDLTSQCKYESGQKDTLSQQNRDQQNTINNCQTQALKLLTPKPFQYRSLVLESTLEGGGKKSTWLILTNKPQNPIEFEVKCTSNIESMDVAIVQQQTASRASPYQDKTWLFQISSPAWTPTSPIVVHTVTDAKGPLSCEFDAKGAT